eukprot:CAMPEP_0197440764 /NCGR_PEP_ID=MMETSP1175-20131217/7186_1 /TAXON_ID=1003142 /ORGANISM="Triceratium dubium, Strain CCMP147" /LENGTH=192 /DNA_ID=CAMNT_0042970929 /DNA_START=694 /DNA_END=1268 /DNA_ORIENTATION=-
MLGGSKVEEERFMCTSLYDAIVTGVCWGIGNTLIRKRLDPAMRNPPGMFVQRHWKDVCCGVLAMSASSLIKSSLKHYIPNGTVEEKLTIVFRSIVGNSAIIQSVYGLIFDFRTEYEFAHNFFVSVKIGLSWGLTSLFIRRGLNSDVRDGGRFIFKYWRDAMYGTLAMSVCVFLKIAVRVWLAKTALLVEERA